MSRARRAGAAFVLGALLLTPSSPAVGERRERLERIREEIEQRERQAEELAQEAQGQLGELESVDRRLAETRRSMRRLRTRRAQAEEELAAARERLARTERSLAELRGEVGDRLVALYKFQSVRSAPALATANDFQHALRVGQGLGRVVEADARLFARFRATHARWVESRDGAADLVGELDSARRELALREERTRRQLVERRNLVALLRSRADREQRAASELREAARRLEEAIERMPRDPRPALGPGLVAGQLPWPVTGLVRLGFGRQVDPEFGTQTLRNGVEIEAERGTAVQAVGAGRVLFAGWFRGYGQVVILDHGHSKITVSGFLDELEVAADDTVGAGQTVGRVGDTGSLSGPGLYFEIREGGKPVDPATWLR